MSYNTYLDNESRAQDGRRDERLQEAGKGHGQGASHGVELVGASQGGVVMRNQSKSNSQDTKSLASNCCSSMRMARVNASAAANSHSVIVAPGTIQAAETASLHISVVSA